MTATPTKPLELVILKRVLEGGIPLHVARELGVPDKRIERWCEKWEDRWPGHYQWGVGISRGFFMDEGKAEVRAWIAAAEADRVE